MKRILTLIGIAAVGTTFIFATVPLKITEKNKSGYKLTIVGKTDPSASVTVDGNKVKVYSSGCFGTTVNLGMGMNDIPVIASKGGEKAVEHIVIDHQASLKPIKEEKAILRKKADFTVTTKDGAYLQYGDGTDRLGASKMGYIDKNIPLKVIEEIPNLLYKVQLSANRYAYVPTDLVKKDPANTSAVNSGNMKARNIGKADRLTITMPARRAYCSWTEIDPAAICIDLFATQCNSNWLTHVDGLAMIDYVDFRQVEGDVMRVIIHLKSKNIWGYSVGYDGNILTVDVRHHPSSNIKDLTIGLDAGHGGKHPGAVGHSGLTEKEINLKLVMLVKERLEKRGAKVVLSRKDDSDVTMAERKKIFKDANVDLAISIHNNAGGSPIEEMGSSTYYKHIFCRRLAETMRRHLLDLGFKDFGLTGNFNFALNQPTEYPNALLEVLFMSSLPDEEKLLDPKWQRKIADAVVDGILEYVKHSD